MRLRHLILGTLVLVLIAGCRSARPSPAITRIDATPRAVGSASTTNSPAALALPAGWAGSYDAALTGAALGGGARLSAADGPAAAAAVRDGQARIALTTATAAAGLSRSEFAAIPVSFTVPLTFPLEDLTAAQARDLAAGRISDWSAVRGPSGRMIAFLPAAADGADVAAALGIPALSADIAVTRGPGVGAGLVIGPAPGPGPGLTRKVLRIDGALPGDAAYPFVEHRVAAGRREDAARVEALAAALRGALDAARPAEVTLDAVGDVMLGRGIGALIAQHGPAYPFTAVRPLLVNADVRFANLEIALTDRGTPAPKDYVFRAPPEDASGLAAAGFNVVSLANNHAFDYGPDGLADTIAALDRAGVAHAGAGRDATAAHAPVLLTVKGVRLAFLAYVNVLNDGHSGFVNASTDAGPGRPGVAWGTPEAIRRDVAAAKAQADVVIVSLHSGYEYTDDVNPTQQQLAHAAIDAGASLVLGGHPHVLQGVEFYHDAPIIYSLGNFVFDLDADDYSHPGLPSVLSVVFQVTLTKDGVQAVRFEPVLIDPRTGIPAPAAGAEAGRVLDRLYGLTNALQ